jgi:hypothetical protein
MPCNMMDGASMASADAEVARQEARKAIDAANKVADILCRVLRAMPPDLLARMDADVQAWFREHQEHDRAQGRY